MDTFVCFEQSLSQVGSVGEMQFDMGSFLLRARWIASRRVLASSRFFRRAAIAGPGERNQERIRTASFGQRPSAGSNDLTVISSEQIMVPCPQEAPKIFRQPER